MTWREKVSPSSYPLVQAAWGEKIEETQGKKGDTEGRRRWGRVEIKGGGGVHYYYYQVWEFHSRTLSDKVSRAEEEEFQDFPPLF